MINFLYNSKRKYTGDWDSYSTASGGMVTILYIRICTDTGRAVTPGCQNGMSRVRFGNDESIRKWLPAVRRGWKLSHTQ
jgi:hypothetical protein